MRTNFEKTNKPQREYSSEDFSKMAKSRKLNKQKRGRKEIEY